VEQEDVMQAMATETFIGNMRGPVIRPVDADYDAVRSLYNGMIDKSPVMIARSFLGGGVVLSLGRLGCLSVICLPQSSAKIR
jgi:hypothetical protein